MTKPWTDGPRELIQHAIDHLELGGDFDRRIAMISIDNAVELMVKVYLGLPERARGSRGPSRKELDVASESFPELLSLLENYAGAKVVGVGLDDIEWYHRLRNQLYHSGNGITVERAKVETYLEIAKALFQSLFDRPVPLARPLTLETKVGQFLSAWNALQREMHLAGYKRPADERLFDPGEDAQYDAVRRFRNDLVHGLGSPDPGEVAKAIEIVMALFRAVEKKRMSAAPPGLGAAEHL